MSNVLASTVCADEAPCDVAKEAGFYDPESSNTTFNIGQTGDLQSVTFKGTTGALSSLTGSADWYFDTVGIEVMNGVAGEGYRVEIENFDMLVIESASEELPDGTTYPVQIGKLGLGAPESNQSWLHFPPAPRWNGTLLPSALFDQELSPSNSYGMHIGSPAMGIPGSLNIGGYEQSRAIAPISSQPYNLDHLPIDLLDIGIGVAEGTSPFDFASISGLLAEGNSSIGIATSVNVEGPIPYIYLPQSTCDAITQHLPVTFDPKYGLYLWNIDDAAYARIVTSPSFLAFTFRLDGSLTKNMTINVPFALLNLTLSAPITSTSTQYLPLRPGSGPHGSYVLGRAFMQAAFVGVNWQTAAGDGDGAWFLAQAPGPNTPSRSSATTIKISDSSLVGSSDSWKDTWKGSWTALGSSDPSPTPSSGPRVPAGGDTADGPGTSASNVPVSGIVPSAVPTAKGLAAGAIAGIAVGAGALLLIGALGATFLYKRSRRRTLDAMTASALAASHSSELGFGESYHKRDMAPKEMWTNTTEVPMPAKAAEMAG